MSPAKATFNRVKESIDLWLDSTDVKGDPNLRTAFQREVEDILQKYPGSIYAAPLRRSLEKFKSRETIRNPN